MKLESTTRRSSPWNAYPWYINSDPTTDQLLTGVEPLRDLIGLMPRLRVVLVHGIAADKGWKLFLRKNLDLIERRGIAWLSTYHTSRQALQTPDRVERKLREASIRNALVLAASVMRATSWPARRPPSRQTEAETEELASRQPHRRGHDGLAGTRAGTCRMSTSHAVEPPTR